MTTLVPNDRTKRSILGCLVALAVLATRVAAGQGAMAATPPTPNNEATTDAPGTEKQRDGSSHEHDHGHRADSPRTAGFSAKLIRWLGKFHPVTVHFPIALLLVAALTEAIWAVSDKPNFRFTARLCLLLGALGAVGAATLGWFLAGFQFTDPTWIRTTHRWLGTSTAAWAILTLVLSEWTERHNRVRWVRSYWATLFLGAALVAVTGFFGGAMVYGLDHYRWPTSTTRTETESTGATDAEAAAVVVEMNDELQFDPKKVTIAAGQTVLWKGVGSFAHTVTADPDKPTNPENVRLPEGASVFDSGRIQPGETFSYTFEAPGSYRYFCIPHELAGMIGEVEVNPEGDR